MVDKIIFDNVSLAFAENKIFENIFLEFDSKKIIVITGSNGSGKSTLLKLAGQFIHPDSGKITAFNDVNDKINNIDFRYKIAAVSPSINFYSEMTAVENINFFVGLRNIRLNNLQIDNLCERVGLDLSCENKYVGNFSTGMIQRLKLAVLLAVNADVLLFDEPCSNLDEEGKKIFFTEIKQAAKIGKLILMATNDEEEVKIGDEIINLPLI